MQTTGSSFNPAKPRRNIIFPLTVLVLSVGLTGWIFIQSDYYREVKRNLKIFGEVYKYIADRYVEDVTPHDLIRAGIDGMLERLDPYTTYYEGDESSDLDLLMTGHYGGIGITIGIKNKMITIISVMDGSPAQRSGLRPGDRITAINGETTQNMRLEQLSQKVKGEPGTEVTLSIQREEGLPAVDVRMKREVILVENIGYAGQIRDRLGYVKLNRFSKTAASDLLNILYEFRKDSIRGLILDLRGNSGGMLDAAVDISNYFIRKGELITFTRGRNQESVRHYLADKEPVMPDVPIAVLVDEGSASASEIVAGAIQDQDRGVIIGKTTFGKGLVQTVYPIEDKSMIKITTAKYYTPSGRCIQRETYPFRKKATDATTGESGTETVSGQDSLAQPAKNIFRTRNGRAVFASGGIRPDIELPADTARGEIADILKRGLLFDFATHFVNRHPVWDSNFIIHDTVIAQMAAFIRQKGYIFQSTSEKELIDLRLALEKEGYLNRTHTQVSELEKLIRKQKEQQTIEQKRDLAQALELELAGRYFGNRFRIKRSFNYDPAIHAATEILSDLRRYHQILNKK